MTKTESKEWPNGSTPWGTTAEVAAYLHVTPSTLCRLRASGEGPKWAALTAHTPRYHRDDVDEWMRLRKVS